MSVVEIRHQFPPSPSWTLRNADCVDHTMCCPREGATLHPTSTHIHGHLQTTTTSTAQHARFQRIKHQHARRRSFRRSICHYFRCLRLFLSRFPPRAFYLPSLRHCPRVRISREISSFQFPQVQASKYLNSFPVFNDGR
jgi:hypothetical protein